ncbi:vacuolar protein sorting-associated protein 54-like [Centruroides sculpturatus]|uniref:vacuolar protein sorting-associated protein 54-like n=1 Tax=Centruroides sculpturatus TaxID=218467 RepID=UPI000C6D25A1|nr:vacuolar protein sorting-associated protein 54-like [Centruroides sculpturatus]
MSGKQRLWKHCDHCSQNITFKTAKEFIQHLRDDHCSKEGGSYVCRYGNNNVCCSLPIEGVSDQDYEAHVLKHHVALNPDEIKTENSSKTEYKINLNEKRLLESKSGSQLLDPVYQPNLIADQFKWTVFDSSQNLPAVLNDPRRVKREFDFFTKTWGDSFVDVQTISYCSHIPEITRAHFEHYLKNTSKRLKKLVKRKVNIPTFHIGDGSIISLSAARWFDKNLPSIESVPKIFLQPDFSLENPETFRAVLPWSQLYPAQQNTFAHQSAKLLQEKLSHYLDIVEVQIARQISMRSEAFFHAMTSHDALMDQLSNVIKAVADLRHRIHKIDEVLVQTPLQVLLLKRRHANYLQVYNKIKLMATVHQTQPTIQLLLSTSEFVGALDLIYTTQEVLSQELAGIHSFRHLGSQLAEIEKVIDKMLQNDFIRYISSELNRPLINSSCELIEKEQLIAIVFGMLRLHRQSFIQIFRDEACTAVKTILKQTVIEVISKLDELDSEESTGSSLGEQTTFLEFQKWLELLQQVFSNLIILLHRIKLIYEVINDVVKISTGNNHLSPQEGSTEFQTDVSLSLGNDIEVMITESEYIKIIVNLKDLLFAVCDHAHERCAKLLSAKAKANKFVSRFHEDKKSNLNLLLNSEQWKQVDVPSEFQDLVDHISQKGTLTVIPKRSVTDNERPAQSFLVVNGQNFAVVRTVLLLLKMVMEYCQCAKNIPMIAPDLLTRLVDLLKFFNSKTSQLLLGAGALQLVGLKTITAKNLALALRCLELMIIYIPYMKAHFQDILTTKQQFMCKHFDEILKDYNNHINELSNKLVTIIGSMFENQLAKWEVKAPVPSSCFRSISKQLTKFHEAVSDLLPLEFLQDLFTQIHADFKTKLRTHLAQLHVNNDGGPQHGLVTQELTFYMESLKLLNVMQHGNINMDDLWPAR